jgi:hypothetical protein
VKTDRYYQWGGPNGIEKHFVELFNDNVGGSRKLSGEEIDFLRNQIWTASDSLHENERELRKFLQDGDKIFPISSIRKFIDWFDGMIVVIAQIREFWENGLIHIISRTRSDEILEFFLPYHKLDGELSMLRFSSIDRMKPSELTFCAISEDEKKEVNIFKGIISNTCNFSNNQLTCSWSFVQSDDSVYEKPTLNELLKGMLKYTCIIKINELNTYALWNKDAILDQMLGK